MKDLLKPRTIFAFMFYGVFCYLVMRQFPIPQELNTVVSVLLGFYFGNKAKKSEVGNDNKKIG